jgi:hypothetical protein
MPLWLLNDLESVDAAVFSGDSFHDPDIRRDFREYMARWERQMKAEDAAFGRTLTPEDTDDF